VVWCGVVWCGVVWCGVVWCGVVWCGVVWCGVVWCGVVLRGVLRTCRVWQPSQKCVLPQQYHDATEQQKRHLCSMNALPCFWHELASDDSDEQLPQICTQPPRDTTSQPSAAQNEPAECAVVPCAFHRTRAHRRWRPCRTGVCPRSRETAAASGATSTRDDAQDMNCNAKWEGHNDSRARLNRRREPCI
jgi:hypothetical protein